MENPSIYSVFERMWQHILEKFNSYISTDVFEAHTSNIENPHCVTAKQIGALPITGGIMENTLTLNGIVLTEEIDYGTDDMENKSGIPGQLYFKKVM